MLVCFSLGLVFVSSKTVFLCRPRCPETHSVDQANLELSEIHLPLVSQVLDLKVYTTMPGLYRLFFRRKEKASSSQSVFTLRHLSICLTRCTFAGSSAPNILDSSRVLQNYPEKAYRQSCAMLPGLPAKGEGRRQELCEMQLNQLPHA